jgi:hypothetical protein
MSGITGSEFATVLWGWRVRRRLSQLELAIGAGTTQRHVSFLEQGRSTRGRDIVARRPAGQVSAVPAVPVAPVPPTSLHVSARVWRAAGVGFAWLGRAGERHEGLGHSLCAWDREPLKRRKQPIVVS